VRAASERTPTPHRALSSRQPLHRCAPRSGVTTFTRPAPRMLAIRLRLMISRSRSPDDRYALAQYPIGWIRQRLRRSPAIIAGLSASAAPAAVAHTIGNARLCRLRPGLSRDVTAASRSSPTLPNRRPEYLGPQQTLRWSHFTTRHNPAKNLRGRKRPLWHPQPIRARPPVNARARRRSPVPSTCHHAFDAPACTRPSCDER
jgi:hypothetical protein